MVSLFRRILCSVIAIQMVMMPLHGASAAVAPTTVMVSDTVAQGLLGTQIGLLTAINVQLGLLVGLQGETNDKLDQILAAIKYIPEDEETVTSDKILLAFSSSLYAAYTGELSMAYNVIKEAGSTTTTQPVTRPVTPPPGGGGGDIGTLPVIPQPGGGGGNVTLPDPDIITNPNFGTPVPIPDLDPRDPYGDQFTFKGTAKLKDFDNKPDYLAKLTQLTKDINRWKTNIDNASESFKKLQTCKNIFTCTTSGITTFTEMANLFGEAFGITFGPQFVQIMEQLKAFGTLIGLIGSIIDLFGGGVNPDTIRKTIEALQANQLTESLIQGGLIMPKKDEDKVKEWQKAVTNLATFLGPINGWMAQVGLVSGLVDTLNKISAINPKKPLPWEDGGNPGDVKPGGPGTPRILPMDTPNTAPLPRTKTKMSELEAMEEILRSLKNCNRNIATSTSNCVKIENQVNRHFQGLSKSRCAAMAVMQQQGPAKLMQDLFLGTNTNSNLCKTALYKTKSGKDGKKTLCPSIASLQAAALSSAGENGAVSSQLNVLIGLSMYNLVMANVNAEQVILQNVCASMGDFFESGPKTIALDLE